MNIRDTARDVFSYVKNINPEEEALSILEKKIETSHIQNLKDAIIKDRQKFNDLFCAFDEKQEEFFSELPHDEPSHKYVKKLLADGVVKVSGLMPQEEVEEVKEFQDLVQKSVHPHEHESGYVSLCTTPPDRNHFYNHWRQFISNQSVRWQWSPLLNKGQIRIQSKNFGGLHAPGANRFIENSVLQKIFAHYNSIAKASGQIDRTNLEWIYPSPINHNGWHRDLTIHSLKAMVLLNDIDEHSAPMLFAKGSHRMSGEFDKQHHYDMFCLPVAKNRQGNVEDSSKDEWPKYASLEVHCGYINEENAPNDIHPKERQSGREITIGGDQYELFVCDGKAGDVVFFDSCGLHSGCRAHDKTRRSIVFSTSKSLSPKSIFFNMMQQGGV